LAIVPDFVFAVDLAGAFVTVRLARAMLTRLDAIVKEEEV